MKGQISMAVGTTIKTIQDIMRKDAGVDGDAQRISQLSWMLFLKIFDDKEMEYELFQKGYRSPMPDRLRWRSWAADPEGITGEALMKFIDDDLFPTLRDLSPDAGSNGSAILLRRVFEDSYNYMKNGTLIRQVANKINEIDFNKTEDRHLFGEIYEKILKDLQSAGNAGEYYTPRAVTQFMVDQVDPKLGEQVLDPACGTGGFLACAIEHIRRSVKTVDDEVLLQKSIHGVEKKPMPHLLCVTNMMLHGIDVPIQIKHDNTLARPLKDYTVRDRVDVIVTNPPFGGVEEDGIETNFPASYQTRETADLFLVLIMHILKDGGRAAIVLPDGTLFGEGVKSRIKEKLLTECNLHTIIRLPNGVFAPYTSIKTNLLFFEKGKPTKEIWYYEHTYPEGYKSYSKTKPIRIEEFDAEKAWWTNRIENEHAWRVPVEQVIENGFNLDIKNPNVAPEENGDPVEILREYERIQAEAAATREALKRELMASLSVGK
ncbi:HsdM family class I SAM-dependent methyltransferase [Methanocalculus chunghsingensis]|nr:class I SAM-dependent DNA methyltransferase [Methanocalculus chunghsingensis]